MEISKITSNLCYYDIRNPIGVANYLSKEETEEEGYTESVKQDCWCDNCFYGRSKLAFHILELKNLLSNDKYNLRLSEANYLDIKHIIIDEKEASKEEDEVWDFEENISCRIIYNRLISILEPLILGIEDA